MMEYSSNDQFASKDTQSSNVDTDKEQKSQIEIDVFTELNNMQGSKSTITITEDLSGVEHVFKSVAKKADLDDTSFLSFSGSQDAVLKTINNLRTCLLRNFFFQKNYDIDIVTISSESRNYLDSYTPYFYTLRIVAKKVGKLYDCTVNTNVPNYSSIAYKTYVKKSQSNIFKIAKIDKPQPITLVHNPNFITFSSFDEVDPKDTRPARIRIDLTKSNIIEWKESKITIKITELQKGKDHEFYGVYKVKDPTDNSFIIDTTQNGDIATIYNLRECLLRNPFFRNNFEIVVNIKKTDDDSYVGGKTLELISKGYGSQYECSIEVFYEDLLQNTTEIEDIELNINSNYLNMTETDKSTLALFYGGWKVRVLNVCFFVGKLNQNDVVENNEYLIVKPELGKYTEEEARVETLKNLEACLLNNQDVVQMFDITLNGSVGLLFTYKKTSKYVLEIVNTPILLFDKVNVPDVKTPPLYINKSKYLFDVSSETSKGTDSIDNGLGDYTLELDVYTNTGVKWGNQNNNDDLVGTYLTTLSKSYFGKPLWFELNTLMSKRSSYSPMFLTSLDASKPSWVDPGTMNDYRIVARRTRLKSTEPIYISDVLYTINGYDYTLNNSHLGYGNTEVDNYTLDLTQNFNTKSIQKVKPLTTCTERTHLKGQKQYFNVILKKRAEAVDEKVELGILYKVYTQSGKKIDEIVDLQTSADDMSVMNTTLLNLDQFLPFYKEKMVGQIDVCLITSIKSNPTKQYVEVSQNISYRILPSGLHTVNDFAFLNRLGGWDSMNFGGFVSNEFKVTSSSIFKTLQPDFKLHSQIESVASKAVSEIYTVQSSPLTSQVVEWLREMSVSPAVYELSTKRYVLIDDMSLKYNTKEDLFQIDLKYHYSDVFNGRMK